jgi:hypothetical protein
VFFRGKQKSLAVKRSVSDDWIAALPRDKSQAFDKVIRRWELGYAMMSVSLDDALSLRSRGSLVYARQQVSIASDLFARLAFVLIAACEAFQHQGRHMPSLPAVEPLNSDFFRGPTAQTAASWSGLLHHVLLGERSRFFQKVRILSDTLGQLDREFHECAGDIADGTTVEPGACWSRLECLHYDFNTCLRESEVMLKCFLRALPADRLEAFSAELDPQGEPQRLRVRPSVSRAPA